jgi:predicted metalloendopeptidase
MMRNLRTTVALSLLMASSVSAPAPLPATLDATRARPGDDFDHYANASWLSSTQLPPGEQSFGPTAMLKALNADRVQSLIEDASNASKRSIKPADRALQQRIGDFYASVADRATIESSGLAPLRSELAQIAAIADRQALSAALGRTLRLDDGSNTQTDGVFGIWVHQGFDEANHYLPHLVQGGLGLATPDAYLSADKGAERARYRAHVAQIMALAGISDADAATQVLSLETAMARTFASRADTDDPVKANNHWSRSDFNAKAPGLDWAAYFTAAGLEKQQEFIVWQPSAVGGLAALAAGQPIDAWKAYLTFHLLDHYAVVLPDAFARLSEDRASNRRSMAIAATNAAFGEAIGKLYVERYFPPRAKAAAATMAGNLRSAFRLRIAQLTWMTPATRSKALAKVDALKIGVGYPDHWTDYSTLRIDPKEAYGNLRRVERFAYAQALAKLRRPVDPAEWSLLVPQVPGAVINFSPNAIQFSAGILQPPYFDPDGDAASNYGSAGAGMAHEISHSFDLLGNLYDSRGRFGKWWAPADEANYRSSLGPLARQFSAYCPRPGLCLDGQRLLGENVADLAGLRVALDAYHRSLEGRSDRVIGGLNGDQRFFLAFARRWQKVQTEAALRHDVEADIHAPGPYRSATVRNLDDWYSAFGVQPSDRLYLKRSDRVRIW